MLRYVTKFLMQDFKGIKKENPETEMLKLICFQNLKVFSIFVMLNYHLHFQQSISCIQTSYAKGKSDRDFPTSLRCGKVRKTSNISSSVSDQMRPGFPIKFGFSGPGCALCPAPDS